MIHELALPECAHIERQLGKKPQETLVRPGISRRPECSCFRCLLWGDSVINCAANPVLAMLRFGSEGLALGVNTLARLGTGPKLIRACHLDQKSTCRYMLDIRTSLLSTCQDRAKTAALL